MENKKLVVILGGSVDFYVGNINLFKNVEEKTGWKIRRDNFENLSMLINDVKIQIKFCWNPTRDLCYESMEKYAKNELKFIVHKPADELIKQIKHAEGVLFLGHCGAFKGEKEQVYIPTSFMKLFFKTSQVLSNNLKNYTPIDKIKLKNCLSGKIKGKDATVITSNITLCPDNMEDKNEDLLIKLANKLSSYGDVVEKEAQVIAKHFKNKCLFGAGIISSDVISVKEHMIRKDNFKPNKDNFANLFIDSVNMMVEKINSLKEKNGK